MGKIMKDGIQYGVGSITDASDIKYGSTNVESALDNLNTRLDDLNTRLAPITRTYSTHGVTVYKIGKICVLSVNEPFNLSHDQNA